jgi:hypothetical protein
MSSFTYGIGINAPLDKLTKVPLIISADFTSLPQPTASYRYSHWDNFYSCNLRVNWLIGNKKTI